MIDGRRIIYLIMIAAVALPVLLKSSLPATRMVAAERMYEVVDKLPFRDGDAAMLWFDFGPNTIAENMPQAEVMLEHLFRRRVPVIIISQYQQAEAFMNKVPKTVVARLQAEMPDQRWKYGEDWVNVGFKPGGSIYMQSLAKSDKLTEFLGKDVNGTPIRQFPRFSKMQGLESLRLIGQVTGLVGVFDNIIQFLQKEGYRPTVIHGCTSITIPEAYIFLDSGQLNGLLEGIAGAAWYSAILKEKFPSRANDTALVRNTALGVAHVVLIALILAGNLLPFFRRREAVHG